MGRMRAGEWVLALGVALLAAGSFLPWYLVPLLSDDEIRNSLSNIASDVNVEAAADMTNWTMWDLTIIPWVAAIAFIFGGFVLLGTLFGRTSKQAILSSVPAAWSGLLLTAMIAIRVFDAPVDGAVNRYGIYVSLAGAALIWLGGWQSMRDERAAPAFELSPEPEVIARERLDQRAAAIGRGDAA